LPLLVLCLRRTFEHINMAAQGAPVVTSSQRDRFFTPIRVSLKKITHLN
jgi:hypothetical protein